MEKLKNKKEGRNTMRNNKRHETVETVREKKTTI